MRRQMLADSIELAQKKFGPWGEMVSQCIEVGVIVPSVLRYRLDKAGLKLTFHSGPGEDAPEGDHPHGAWVLIREGETIVARAYSHDKDDALLQAVCAELKAEAAPHLQAAAKQELAQAVREALASADPEAHLAAILGFEVAA